MTAPLPTSSDQPASVTALEPSARYAKRVVIKVNGRPVATLSIKLAEQLQLQVGLNWSDELAQRVSAAVAFDQALTKASKWINRRPLSKSRLIERMHQHAWPTTLIDQVVTRLEQLGLIDDAALGRQLLDEWARQRPAGSALLQQKLLAQGLPESLVDELLAEQTSQTDPLTLATQLAEKKMRTLQRLTPIQQKRRLYGLLARRGFDESVIMQVIEKQFGS